MKKIVFFSILAMLMLGVHFSTKSFIASVFSGVFFLILWFLVANFVSLIKGKSFREFLSKVSEYKKFPPESDFAEGYMYLGDKINVAGVAVDSDGLYIFSSGICECIIPWENIFKIHHMKKNGMQVIRIVFQEEKNNEQDFFVPWKEGFSTQIK